jgi:hypothetical protein
MRCMHPRTALAFGAVLIGASVTMAAPYIPDHWGWFMSMTVFGMAGGFVMSLAIGTVVAAMCLGAAFGELLIMAGKPELNASPVAWGILQPLPRSGWLWSTYPILVISRSHRRIEE